MTTVICECCGFAGPGRTLTLATTGRSLWRRVLCGNCEQALEDAALVTLSELFRHRRNDAAEQLELLAPARRVGPFTVTREPHP